MSTEYQISREFCTVSQWRDSALSLLHCWRTEGTKSTHQTEKVSWDRKMRQAALYNQWIGFFYRVTYSQGRIGVQQATMQNQSHTVPPRGHWGNFVVNPGYGVGAWKQDVHSSVKIHKWVTSLMGAGNTSVKVSIIVWGLTEHRGHLVLMILNNTF